jgi:hypothetical protein
MEGRKERFFEDSAIYIMTEVLVLTPQEENKSMHKNKGYRVRRTGYGVQRTVRKALAFFHLFWYDVLRVDAETLGS